MKIILINLFSPYTGSKYTSGLTNLEPIGLEYIGAVAQQNGHNVKILSPFPSEDIKKFSLRVIDASPDILGIGPATYNFNQAKSLAKIIKKQCKDLKVIFGGYHVTALPEEVTDPVIDIAVQGEGEKTFSEILSCIQKGVSYENVPGISFINKHNKLIINPRNQRITDLDSLPYPLRTKKDMAVYKCGGIYYPPPSLQHSTAQIVYSRGCPHACSYCSSKNMWGRSVIYRKADKVIDEIQYLQNNFGTNLIFFTDLTFNANKKKVEDLCAALIKRNIHISWFCACRTEGIDEELITTMKAAGCSRIHFGIESIDKHSLIQINRRKTYETIQESLELTSKHGIITRAYLMIGYPWEKKQHLDSINHNLNKLYIDDLRISFFTPFPGSAIYNQSLPADWDSYTTDKPFFHDEEMTSDEIAAGCRDLIFSNFYSSTEYLNRLKEKLSNHPHLYGSFNEFFQDNNFKHQMPVRNPLDNIFL